MNYKMFTFFFLIWMVAAMVTTAVERVTDPSDVEGSTADFEDFGNTIFAGEELQIDRPVAAGSNPVSGTISFGNVAKKWVTFMFRSASLQSPIWEGWAAPIRYTILILQIPMLLLLLLEGARVLSGFIPFT